MRAILIATALLIAPAAAQACGRPGTISFPRGATGAELQGGVARGETACWALQARAGQTLEATVASLENNAVFQIYQPGWKAGRDGVEGFALPGAAEGQDARQFTGTLPTTGRYLIVVGATRGGADYRLRVGVR